MKVSKETSARHRDELAKKSQSQRRFERRLRESCSSMSRFTKGAQKEAIEGVPVRR